MVIDDGGGKGRGGRSEACSDLLVSISLLFTKLGYHAVAYYYHCYYIGTIIEAVLGE